MFRKPWWAEKPRLTDTEITQIKAELLASHKYAFGYLAGIFMISLAAIAIPPSSSAYATVTIATLGYGAVVYRFCKQVERFEVRVANEAKLRIQDIPNEERIRMVRYVLEEISAFLDEHRERLERIFAKDPPVCLWLCRVNPLTSITIWPDSLSSHRAIRIGDQAVYLDEEPSDKLCLGLFVRFGDPIQRLPSITRQTIAENVWPQDKASATALSLADPQTASTDNGLSRLTDHANPGDTDTVLVNTT